jgi:hypothetical protein
MIDCIDAADTKHRHPRLRTRDAEEECTVGHLESRHDAGALALR